MQAAGREDEHYDFIKRTDRKSLFTQIKALVTKAEEVAAEELQQRSDRLRTLLVGEDKVYEKEFSSQVMARIDLDIRSRKEVLDVIHAQHEKRQKEFIENKKIQRMVDNCYEVRQAMRKEDVKNTKICQEEQILENQRKRQRECEIEKYWRAVEQRRLEEYDRTERFEQCKRHQMKDQYRRVLNVQVGDIQARREQEREEKRQEALALAKEMEAMRLEKFDAEHRLGAKDQTKYREELQSIIDHRKAQRELQWLKDKLEHEAFMEETQRLEAEAQARIDQGKRDLKEATLEYLAYVRQVRALEQGIKKMMDDRIEDLHHVDMCTKNNIAEKARIKAEEAARCHTYLNQQICEEAERRLRLEAEVHENKIIENRFAHPEVTREVILAKYRKNRRDLDDQIVEMRRLRKEEEKLFEQQLLKAIDDPATCTKLAMEYVRDRTDYLPVHPNWKILYCSENKYVEKAPMTTQQMDALIKDSNVDKCPYPDVARRNCGFMATQCADAGNSKQPPTAQVHEDIPPEGQTTTTKDLKSCLCPPPLKECEKGHMDLFKK